MNIKTLIPTFLVAPALLYGTLREDLVVSPIPKIPPSQCVTQVTPAENVMRQHGTAVRLLLIYEKLYGEMVTGNTSHAEALQKTATIFRSFIENFHSTVEEVFIFPKLQKANVHRGLIDTLQTQHLRGRNLTDYILAHANAKDLKDPFKKWILRPIRL